MNAKGSVFKYPDNVDTDVIIPARHLNTQDAKELASHCMEDIDKDFVKKVKDGDIMVGGWNFGCGSSREHAPLCIKTAGISVVIAKSFARIHRANLINNGILPLEFADEADYDRFSQDDEIRLDGVAERVRKGESRVPVTNVTKGFTAEMKLELTERQRGMILAGGLIGTFIGAIPGAGGDIAVFVSYGASKSASKHPELYGTGIPNGVAATESANNGCSGGAMIPLLSLGVPGDSVTAILLGAFIMKGITPGPMMYVTELPTVYRVFAALMLANLCMLVVGCLGVRFFAKIVSVEKKMLYPIILVISLLGAFSINKNVFDVGVCVVFGVIGWLMNKYEFPLSPILLALILGPMCEKNFVRYMNIQRGNFFAITTSPIAMVFATVAILVIVYSVYNQSKINKRAAANAAKENA